MIGMGSIRHFYISQQYFNKNICHILFIEYRFYYIHVRLVFFFLRYKEIAFRYLILYLYNHPHEEFIFSDLIELDCIRYIVTVYLYIYPVSIKCQVTNYSLSMN